MHKLRLRTLLLVLLVVIGAVLHASPVGAQSREHGTDAVEAVRGDKVEGGAHSNAEAGHSSDGGHGSEDSAHGGEHGAAKSPLDPHAGSWVNPIARAFSGESPPKLIREEGSPEAHVDSVAKIKYDYIVIAFLVMGILGVVGMRAGRNVKVRPAGKPHSATNIFEAAVEGLQNYLVGIMGVDMARKYTPLIATFFLTILLCNWMGLVPGMIAPTSNANVPLALAIVAFFATHIIAIREVGVKPWFMHFVGEPKWLAFLNFPLHLIGELIKPISLAIRLLCNVFGEEMVIVQLALLAIASLPIWLPIPLQFPIMCLGVFFGALQALVFSTLLAIYISILATHHDDHDGHGHVEHVEVGGKHQTVSHPTQTSVA